MCDASHVYLLDGVSVVSLFTLNSSQEHSHFLCFFLFDFLHGIEVHEGRTKLHIEDSVAAEDQLNPGLKGELIQTEMSQEGSHGELYYSLHLSIGEDKDLERWSVD